MSCPRGLEIERGRPLAPETTFKIGGRAKMWFEPRGVAELSAGLEFCRRKKMPIFVIGAGSNVLVPDKGVQGMVIALRRGGFARIKGEGGRVYCGAGVRLGRLLNYCLKQGLGGLEFLAGIPGTLGGALMTNAGAGGRNKAIGNVVKAAHIIDYCGRARVLSREDMRFGYRRCRLYRGIILGADLRLRRRDRGHIRRDIDGYRRYRRGTQDLSCPSAGCVFKNPASQDGSGNGEISAGRLIALCGLKGKSAGDAIISPIHANFILNKGRARAKDVLRLMQIAKARVKKRFAVDLKEELVIWS